MDFVKWKDSSTGGSILLNHNKPEDLEAGEDDASPALLCMVGIVSEEMLQLDYFGSWSEKYGEKLTKAKLKFTLMKPTGHIDFESDFDRAMATILKLQTWVSIRGSDRSWFYQNATSLRFRHDLFKEKVSLCLWITLLVQHVLTFFVNKASLPNNDNDMDEGEKEAFKEAKLEDMEMGTSPIIL